MAQVRSGAITLKGNPVDLEGPELKVGDAAPDFKLQGADLSDVSLSTSAGKTRIIASVPSLDTAVCSLETKRFNEEAAKLGDVPVLVVSTDLPFGQKRWCGSEGVESVVTLSDHRECDFGSKYGVKIASGPLTRCLARAIFVVGADDKIKYVEYVPEVAQEPNYEAAIAAAKA